MDPEPFKALQRYLSGTSARQNLAELVASYDICNGWQDEDPEVLSLRSTIGALDLALCEVDEGLRDEPELRRLVEHLLSEAALPG
jgi:hypothetical protein